jgi:hypothetical protein
MKSSIFSLFASFPPFISFFSSSFLFMKQFARFFRSSDAEKGRKKVNDDVHKHHFRRRRRGVLQSILDRSIHGPSSFVRFTHISEIPPFLDRNLTQHSEGTWMETKDLLLLWEKQESNGARLIDCRDINKVLNNLFLLTNNANDELSVHRADEMVGNGVLSALVRIVSSDQPPSPPPGSDAHARWHSSLLLAMTLFRETLYLVGTTTMSNHGMWGKEFLKVVVKRASDVALFETSIGLLEELLAMDGDILESSIDLSEVPEFLDMLEKASPRNLAFACRVLPVFVFDQKEKIEKVLGDAHGIEQMENITVELRPDKPMQPTRNQSILLSRPRILERLFDLLHLLSLPQVRHIHRLLVQGASDDVLTLVNGDIIRRLVHQKVGALSDWEVVLTYDPDRHVDTGLKEPVTIEQHLDWVTQDAFTIASNESEIMLLISSLLSSRRREQLRDISLERNISKYLKQLLQIMNWDPQWEPQSAPHPLHGPGCTCNMDSAMKIQLMRVLHSLVDRTEPTAMCVQQAASFRLPTVIATAMKSSPPASEYKYWMRSCLEAYVRSGGLKAQEMLICDGVLDALVSDLILPTFKGSGSLQTAFDLLGELVKFNVFAFQRMDALLADPTSFASFYDVVMGSLVDSNVFLRSLFLSARYFSAHRHKEYVMGSSPLCRFLDEENEIVSELMGSVTPDKISQENMCCLNTAVLFCLLARTEGRLGKLLTVSPNPLKEFFTSLWCVPQLIPCGCGCMSHFLSTCILNYGREFERGKEEHSVSKHSRHFCTFGEETICDVEEIATPLKDQLVFIFHVGEVLSVFFFRVMFRLPVRCTINHHQLMTLWRLPFRKHELGEMLNAGCPKWLCFI